MDQLVTCSIDFIIIIIFLPICGGSELTHLAMRNSPNLFCARLLVVDRDGECAPQLSLCTNAESISVAPNATEDTNINS